MNIIRRRFLGRYLKKRCALYSRKHDRSCRWALIAQWGSEKWRTSWQSNRFCKTRDSFAWKRLALGYVITRMQTHTRLIWTGWKSVKSDCYPLPAIDVSITGQFRAEGKKRSRETVTRKNLGNRSYIWWKGFFESCLRWLTPWVQHWSNEQQEAVACSDAMLDHSLCWTQWPVRSLLLSDYSAFRNTCICNCGHCFALLYKQIRVYELKSSNVWMHT
jgi:hypothetical protein